LKIFIIYQCLKPIYLVIIKLGLQLGKPKVLYFGPILKQLYWNNTKTYGLYNGTLTETNFYKPTIKLPYAPAWTLEDMVAAAKKQGITIQYETVYKTLSVQEKDFFSKNSKTPTVISKSSTLSEVKNGRLYNGSKWYPTTITVYNPLPGFNIFGTGLCIRIKNNNEKIINFIKTNGSSYGWSWSADIPLADPDFQNVLVYYAGYTKPSKYRDRTKQEVDDFKPLPPQKGVPGPNQGWVWVPDSNKKPDQVDRGIVSIDPDTGVAGSTISAIGTDSGGGHWEIISDSDTGGTTGSATTKINPIWDQNQRQSILGPVVLVVNATSVKDYAVEVANTLKYIGISSPKIVLRKKYNIIQRIFYCARIYQ
jgi:hypothetical protein